MGNSHEGGSLPFEIEAIRHRLVTSAVINFPREIIQYNRHRIPEKMIQEGLEVWQSIVSEWSPNLKNNHGPCLVVQISPALGEMGISLFKNFEGLPVFIRQTSSD